MTIFAIDEDDNVPRQPGEGSLLAFVGAPGYPASDLNAYDFLTGAMAQLTDGSSPDFLPVARLMVIFGRFRSRISRFRFGVRLRGISRDRRQGSSLFAAWAPEFIPQEVASFTGCINQAIRIPWP
jgi:hypothetical protein